MSLFFLQFVVNIFIPASDRALAPLEVRPAVRKMAVSGGRPVLDLAASRLTSGDTSSLQKAELTLKSGEKEKEEEEEEGRPGEEEKTNPVIESQLSTVNLATPRQRLRSTSNSTRQVGWVG